MRWLLQVVPVLVLAAVLPGWSWAQEAGGDLASLREATRASIVEGCVAAQIEPAVRTAVRKAQEAGRTDATEDSMRAAIESGSVRPLIAKACSCALAESLAQLDQARTPAELDAMTQEMLITALPRLMKDEERIKARCAPIFPAPVVRTAPSAPTWVRVGSWRDGDGYVDRSSVKWLAKGKPQAWVKTVFLAPRPLSPGVDLLSIQALQNYDCAEETIQNLTSIGFSDRDGTAEAYHNDQPEQVAKFEASAPGTRGDAMRRWVCDTEAGK